MNPVKVLIVEDDETARTRIGHEVEKEDFTVVLAADGAEGLEKFKTEKPDIVITDLRLPKVEGLELLHTIKQMEPHTPVILVTGFGNFETVLTALRQGALDYLNKPIDLNALSIALGRAKERVFELRKAQLYPTILMMDDEEPTRIKLARVLEKEGYHVLQAGDGLEGLKLFQAHKIDIALLDIKMPKMDGLQTLHELRKITVDFEAIIFSGYGDETSAVQAMRDGAVNFLRKPIDLDQLTMGVRRALDKLHSERSLRHRTRELELMQQISAHVTSKDEVVVDTRGVSNMPARDFAERILNVLPVNLIVLDHERKMLYANDEARKTTRTSPEQLTKETIGQLSKTEISDADMAALTSKIDSIGKSTETTLDSVSIGSGSIISMTKITLLGEAGKQNAVVLVFRNP